MIPCLYRLIFCLSVLYLLAGCQFTPNSPSSPGYDYFPLATGRFVVYDVEEFRYGLNSAPTQRRYQRKEVVGPAYTDVTGETTYRLVRYWRITDSQPWQADSVWSARLVNNEAIRTENGLDFVKLTFPAGDRLRWNGNRLNALGNDEYEMRNSGQPYRVLDKQYAETVMVVAQNDSTLVAQDKRIEVYARQIGLIFKEQTQLQYCSSTPACIGTYQIDYGTRHIFRIRSYGME